MNIVLVTVPIPEIPWNTGSFPPLGLLYLAGGVKPLTKVKVSLVDAFCEGLNVCDSRWNASFPPRRIWSACPWRAGT